MVNEQLKNRGLLKTAQGETTLSESIPIPTLRDDHLIVQTVAVALNPTDWQTLDERPKPGTKYSLLGCDAAGIVTAVGKNVKTGFRCGDRVAGITHGGNDDNAEDGAFADWITLNAGTTFKIPDHVSFEEAATLPCGLATVALALYKHLDLPLPSLEEADRVKTDGPPLLIYGGSSATGTLAIQFAKLSGRTVITTASPHNFDLLKSLGADHVFDYRDSACGQAIRSLTENRLTQVLDTIATPSSAEICAAALSSNPGGTYVNLMGCSFPRADVKNIFFLGATVLGEQFEIEGEVWDAVPEDYERALEFFPLAGKLLSNGLIKNHPVGFREGGLSKVLDGMMELKRGEVSGVKLVYRITDP